MATEKDMARDVRTLSGVIGYQYNAREVVGEGLVSKRSGCSCALSSFCTFSDIQHTT